MISRCGRVRTGADGCGQVQVRQVRRVRLVRLVRLVRRDFSPVVFVVFAQSFVAFVPSS